MLLFFFILFAFSQATEYCSVVDAWEIYDLVYNIDHQGYLLNYFEFNDNDFDKLLHTLSCLKYSHKIDQHNPAIGKEQLRNILKKIGKTLKIKHYPIMNYEEFKKSFWKCDGIEKNYKMEICQKMKFFGKSFKGLDWKKVGEIHNEFEQMPEFVDVESAIKYFEDNLSEYSRQHGLSLDYKTKRIIQNVISLTDFQITSKDIGNLNFKDAMGLLHLLNDLYSHWRLFFLPP